MKALALVALCGCSQIFGLHAPARGDGGGGGGDARTNDATDAHPGACVTQPDCPTSACLPDGSCAADTDVAWLDPASTVTTPCTMAMPCYRLYDALQTGRPYIRVHGTISNLSGVNRAVTIFGEPGAAFGNAMQSLSITANVAVYDLQLAVCLQASAGASLTLGRVVVNGCSGYGVTASGPLTMDRSTVSANKNGGIQLNANGSAQFTITNSFIVGNDSQQQSQFGAIDISSSSIAPGSRLDFNTIVDNNAKSAGTAAGGVYCNDPTFTATGNIISHNLVAADPQAPNANTLGICSFSASIIQADVTSLAFIPGGYHIGPTSSAIDVAGLTSTLDHDFDGQSRPFGAGYDVGADEYHP